MHYYQVVGICQAQLGLLYCWIFIFQKPVSPCNWADIDLMSPCGLESLECELHATHIHDNRLGSPIHMPCQHPLVHHVQAMTDEGILHETVFANIGASHEATENGAMFIHLSDFGVETIWVLRDLVIEVFVKYLVRG